MKELEQEVKQAFDQVGLSGFSSLLRPTKNTNFGDYQFERVKKKKKKFKILFIFFAYFCTVLKIFE